MERFVIIDTVRFCFLGATVSMEQADAISEIKAKKNNTYLAGEEPHWYYIFTKPELFRLYKNTVGELPPQHIPFQELTEAVAKLGSKLPVDTTGLEELLKKGPKEPRIGLPVGYIARPTAGATLVPGKLSPAAQKRCVPKCGLIEPIKYPREGSVSRKIWELADKMVREYTKLPTSKELIKRATRYDIKASTVTVQFSKWRKAHPGHQNYNEWDPPKH